MTTHGTPARRARSAATVTACQVGACSWPRASSWPSMTTTAASPGQGAQAAARAPTTTAAPARAWAQSVGHARPRRPPARRSRPASTPARLAEGTTTSSGPRWASSATSGRGVGGRRQADGDGRADREGHPSRPLGGGGRRAGAGLAAGRRVTAAGAARPWSAGSRAGRPSATPPSRPGPPRSGSGPQPRTLAEGPQGQPGAGLDVDLDHPAADPAGRPGRRGPACRRAPSGARRSGTG